MRKTMLYLLGGLLIVSLSRGGDSKAAEQSLCVAVSSNQASSCHLTSDVTRHIQLDAPVVFPGVPEPAEESKIALTSRFLQLMDAFAELVMVI